MFGLCLQGAPANATYNVFEGFASEGQDQLGVLLTDSSGNGTADFRSMQARGLIIMNRVGGGQVLSGFIIP